jgi:ergothioneine biosynthesis protein EgtB
MARSQRVFAARDAPEEVRMSVTPRVADALTARFDEVRAYTECLASPLTPEDQTVQSMPDVSPTKWHRAHVTWFFETFLLAEHENDFVPFSDEYGFLFNSYYESVGPRYQRQNRGLISRPGAHEVGEYRRNVNERVREVLSTLDEGALLKAAPVVELGFHHEQQHQELMLMDIKHVLSLNPMRPIYGGSRSSDAPPDALSWIDDPGGFVEVGHDGPDFAFDNEAPRHRVWLEPFRIADRLITNGEWLEFMVDGGYVRHELWLSDGWAHVKQHGWAAPLYWVEIDGEWYEHTLNGTWPLNPALPVSHVSYYEADAYAAWADARLPSEAEWEHVVARGAQDLPPGRCVKRSGTAGSGRPRRTTRIRGTARQRGRSVSTTASSCRIRWCCVADRLSRLQAMRGRPTATSFRTRRGGP